MVAWRALLLSLRRRLAFAHLILSGLPLILSAAGMADTGKSGKALYDFYCYQCHGYAGDGRTLAATYLDPPPRDFTSLNAELVSRAQMLETLELGRPGTAMVSFADVIDPAGRERVIDFIRAELMRTTSSERRYHTREN